MDIDKKYIDFFLKIVLFFLIAFLIYIFFTSVFKWFLPFILAYILASIINPLVNVMEVKLRIPRKIACLTTILFTLFFLGLIIFIIIYRITFEIKNLTNMLPIFAQNISDLYNDLFVKGVDMYDKIPSEFDHIINTFINGVLDSVSTLFTSLTEYTTRLAYNFAKSLPSIFIFVIVLFISTYFMISDKRKISNYFLNQIPKELLLKLVNLKKDLIFALFGYIKAQLILMFITFIELSIGMIIIGVDYPILLALFISIIDALPVLGTGIILLPWAFFELLSGNFSMAICLIILYCIVLLVRQMLEPRVIGKQIGLYPLVTLMSMYIGLKIFGIIGLILGPISILIIKSLLKSNFFPIWKE